MRKLVYGVGVNDSDSLVTKTESINGKRKQIEICPVYNAWRSMLARCYSSSWVKKFPTYTGCYVADEWHSFTAFKEWCKDKQVSGMDLDKDILCPGNKLYSPGKCAFITPTLNYFINSQSSKRGSLPIGVSAHKASGKFTAQCSDPFSKNRGYLGLFDDPEAAHAAWKKRKHELACRLADLQKDERVAVALRYRYL